MNDELRVKNNDLGGKMKYRYRTDEEMKDSGVEWLDVIPKSWTRNKLKRELKFLVGSTPSTSNRSFFEGENIWVTIGDLNGKYCSESKTKLTEEALRSTNMKKVPKGSLLYSFKLSVGQVAFTETDLYTNEAIASFYPNNNSNLDFWYYALGNYLIENSNENIYGAKLLNQELINNANIFVPSEEEQKKIAKFLDKKTAQFDSIISKKEALIEKLEEAKKSLISEVVTGKVRVVKTNDGYELVERKKEEMKDSGVEWLGLVPKGWKIIKLKYLATLMNKKVKSNSVDKYIGLENVESKTGFIISYTDPEKVESDLSTYFDRNMVLFGKLRPYLAKCVVTETSGICSDEFLVLRTLRLSPNILKYIMLNSEFIDLVNSSTYGAKMPRANWDFISNIKVPFFSADEQTIIEEFIIYKCNSIDKIINIKKQQIEKLKEAKQSLISEAVTGKIEILD